MSGWETSVPDAMDPGGRYNREQVRTGFGSKRIWVSAAVHDALIAIAEKQAEFDSEAQVVRYCIKLGLEHFAKEEIEPCKIALSRIEFEEIFQQSAAEQVAVDQLRDATNANLSPYELDRLKAWAEKTLEGFQDPDKRAQFERYLGRL